MLLLSVMLVTGKDSIQSSNPASARKKSMAEPVQSNHHLWTDERKLPVSAIAFFPWTEAGHVYFLPDDVHTGPWDVWYHFGSHLNFKPVLAHII